MGILRVLLFGVCCYASFALGSDIQTSKGNVSGTTQDGISVFKGIPYAAPPVGELRWRAPQPGSPWTGQLDASEFGPVCPQQRSSRRPEAEDCLTLNIWAPEKPKKPLPVMVWIHGGAHVNGSGRTDGTSFAADDVVLVSINYRLGRFGVFAHPELVSALPDGEAMGNYGLLDQIAALHWVQQEIGAFGGDPDRVTIFGVSAGGSNVNLLMVSPLARGLFHGAISESGANGLAVGRGMAAQLDVGTAVQKRHNAADITALRALPWRELVEQAAGYRQQAGPIVDGVIIPQSVRSAFMAGRQHNVPYIAGANSNEGSLAAAIPIPAYQRVLDQNIEKATALYGMPADDPQLSLDFYGDMLFVAPTRFLVMQMAKVTAPAWQYHFDYVMESRKAFSKGANHGAEVGFVFERLRPLNLRKDNPRWGLKAGNYPVTPRDLEVSAMLHDYWVTFAKSGKPGDENQLPWPAYDSHNPATLHVSNANVAVKQKLRAEILDFVEAGYLR